MVSREDPRYVWVCASGDSSGDGTHKNPFGRIQSSLVKVQPGQTVVLLGGTYHGDVTFEGYRGAMDKPLRIAAAAAVDPGAPGVIVNGSCWYFYDVSDVIVSGIVFRDSPLGSIAVTGASERNRFEHLKFENCCAGSADQKASCSLFFGGSGAAYNIVEQCTFERTARPDAAGKGPDERSVGIMISEGDAFEGAPIVDHVIRKNRFVNYDYGVLVGASDAAGGQYGHLIAYNTIDNCTTEGIMVKCGDTHVKGNTVINCPKNAVSVAAGESTVVEDNRILDCGVGIRIAGKGHTVSNNCIVRCAEEAIKIMGKNGKAGLKTENVILEKNTCVAWSQSRPQGQFSGISIGQDTNAIVRRNLFLGPGKPCEIVGDGQAPQKVRHCILDNYSPAHAFKPENGMSCGQVIFSGIAIDNYDNATGYGAQGWMVRPEPFDPDDFAQTSENH